MLTALKINCNSALSNALAFPPDMMLSSPCSYLQGLAIVLTPDAAVDRRAAVEGHQHEKVPLARARGDGRSGPARPLGPSWPRNVERPGVLDFEDEAAELVGGRPIGDRQRRVARQGEPLDLAIVAIERDGACRRDQGPGRQVHLAGVDPGGAVPDDWLAGCDRGDRDVREVLKAKILDHP